MSDMTPHGEEKMFSGGELPEASTRVKIIGVGGAGANTVDRLRIDSFQAAQLAVINTDAKALASSPVSEKITIGRAITRGLSAGGESEIGRSAAEADRELISRAVAHTDLVFLVAGLGGGTGSGAAPVIADIATQKGAMVIAFVTMPFSMEGGRRTEQAQAALDELRLRCEAVIPLYNDLLMQFTDTDATVLDAFAQADAWINRGIGAICSMLFRTGLINIDFASLRGAFPVRGGKTLFTLGSGEGKDAVFRAVEELLNSPLLNTRETLRHAETLLVNIMSGPGLTLPKANEIVNKITEKFGGRENTVLGAIIDECYGDRIEICVIGSSGGVSRQRKQTPHAEPVAEIPDPETPASAQPPQTVKPSRSPAGKGMTIGAAVDKSISSSTTGKPIVGPKPSQVEIDFEEQELQRNFFDKTKRTMLEGQDIDVPTYLRRGIKITL
ncbi:MAG: cell division FtsZ family protein [Puniceicoccales bacterium]|jgi:cell division protein FtsZ|nr:cell division FtsZ family protein [Puniceicoccales bacterium]